MAVARTVNRFPEWYRHSARLESPMAINRKGPNHFTLHYESSGISILCKKNDAESWGNGTDPERGRLEIGDPIIEIMFAAVLIPEADRRCSTEFIVINKQVITNQSFFSRTTASTMIH
jgi:hypothetical protein